jgi:hypothetical protein
MSLVDEIIGDTVLHSWEVLSSILSSDKTTDILCDIGMCVHFPSYPTPSPSFLNPYIIHSVPTWAIRIQTHTHIRIRIRPCAGQ